ncbi:MAG: DUF1848 domain-containing protein [Proteobacteria bacterium]|nr:DUF1848 domain-containing protein [Pseudomonadota bacterium]
MPGSGSRTKQVISASRRTDIPAFYMDWFMESLSRGFFEVENPYSRTLLTIPVNPDNTHTLVFWSKNFGPFIQGGYGEKLTSMGYHLFFNFTINSDHPILEPHVPELSQRLKQLTFLCDRFDSKAITWRFDPICHYQVDKGREQNNLSDVQEIAEHAARAGIGRCVTSFVDLYTKVLARTGPDFSLVDIPRERKINLILSMENLLLPLGIRLFLCCEKEILMHLPKNSTVAKAACIPSQDLIKLFGQGISRAQDRGQRKNQGCGCGLSRDIGSYRFHPCYHNCLFCYANPREPRGYGHD